MSIRKYPLNHAVDAEVPAATQSEHASLSDTDELLEIKNVIASAFGVTATISESEEDELKDNLSGQSDAEEGQRQARPLYAGPAFDDLVFGNDPVFGGQKAPEESENEQLVIFP